MRIGYAIDKTLSGHCQIKRDNTCFSKCHAMMRSSYYESINRQRALSDQNKITTASAVIKTPMQNLRKAECVKYHIKMRIGYA